MVFYHLMFGISLATQLLFAIIFILRKRNLIIVEKYGKLFFLLSIPAIIAVIIGILETVDISNYIFLGIYFIFMAYEYVVDYHMKIDFRENIKIHWKWAVPYIVLYYMMGYGLVVIPWEYSMTWGIICLVLWIIDLGLNMWSH